jgi:hypothetical protein
MRLECLCYRENGIERAPSPYPRAWAQQKADLAENLHRFFSRATEIHAAKIRADIRFMPLLRYSSNGYDGF